MFLGGGVGRVFFGAVLPMFLLYFLVFRSRKCLEKILLMSGLVFVGFFSLPLVFRRRRRLFVLVFFLKRESLGSNRAHPHTHLGCFFLFLFFCPAALVCSPVLAVRPASWRFFGVPFWAPHVFGILLELTGARSPLLRPFSGREAARVFWSVLSVVFVFPFCCVTRRGGPVVVRGIPPGRRTGPAPE